MKKPWVHADKYIAQKLIWTKKPKPKPKGTKA
jgi:hypothetical protein